jgi:cyclopropane fatty-acyl-phospholipid synthase-like methyltransferase
MDNLKNVSKTVINCYELLDAALAGGVEDFTDGKYFDNPNLSYQQAQENQAEWLLDQIKCKSGHRILDVGCGNGRILEAAQKRGAKAEGITISKEQVTRSHKKGLSVYLMSYRDIPEGWNNRFDGVIANGSIEHFVQAGEALNEKQNEIYREMFQIFYRLLKPGGYLVTTVIHFNSQIDPKEIIEKKTNHPRGSNNFHFTKVLLTDFGGWYPTEKQLQNNAYNLFSLESREDGTQDYFLTSEHWLSEMKKKMLTSPKVWLALLKKIFNKPKETLSMLDNLIISQSWMWQFRGEDGRAPTKLFRDVWKRLDS